MDALIIRECDLLSRISVGYFRGMFQLRIADFTLHSRQALVNAGRRRIAEFLTRTCRNQKVESKERLSQRRKGREGNHQLLVLKQKRYCLSLRAWFMAALWQQQATSLRENFFPF
jgi:hypothetical protein